MGTNPYITAANPPAPKSKYRLTIQNTGQVIEVDPDALPDHDGCEGSILGFLLEAGIDIDHACGGVCACSTCHVYVREGEDTSPAAIEEEEDMLDMAPGLEETSRLACQCVPDGSKDVVIELPSWKRNEVSEDH